MVDLGRGLIFCQGLTKFLLTQSLRRSWIETAWFVVRSTRQAGLPDSVWSFMRGSGWQGFYMRPELVQMWKASQR